MMRTISKALIGVGLGIMINMQLSGQRIENRELISLLILLWSLGMVFGFVHHISVIVRMLNPSLKLSVISFLSFKSGFLGLFPLVIYIIYALVLGWIHGLMLMAREIAGLREHIERD